MTDVAFSRQQGCLRRAPDSVLATPIFQGPECLGLLHVQSDTPDAFDEKEQLTCVRLSGLYGLAIHVARLSAVAQSRE